MKKPLGVRTHWALVALGMLLAVTVIVAVQWRAARAPLALHAQPVNATSAAAPSQSPVESTAPAPEPSAAPPVVDFTGPAASGLPTDPGTPWDGTVATLTAPAPVAAQPAGPGIITLPTTLVGGITPTSLPVLAEQDGSLLVLLPTRPNGATGWIPASTATLSQSAWRVTVSLTARTITLTNNGQVTAAGPISAGTTAQPTPTGRTFIAATYSDPAQDFSPVIVATGFHMPQGTYGDDVVGLHGWPDETVIDAGAGASSGCVRVKSDVLGVLAGVPLGTVVEIAP